MFGWFPESRANIVVYIDYSEPDLAVRALNTISRSVHFLPDYNWTKISLTRGAGANYADFVPLFEKSSSCRTIVQSKIVCVFTKSSSCRTIVQSKIVCVFTKSSNDRDSRTNVFVRTRRYVPARQPKPLFRCRWHNTTWSLFERGASSGRPP
jgi:hypothetical protein